VELNQPEAKHKNSESLFEIENLEVSFSRAGVETFAVNGVSFSLKAGETLGIVGESGSGKSATCLAAMKLLPSTIAHIKSSQMRIDGLEFSAFSERQMRDIRGPKIGMIFQDPMSSLNPVLSVGVQITEAITAHQNINRQEAEAEAVKLISKVGIPQPATILKRYPHELSGGMRQRIVIAIAIALKPRLIIADEPTTALDPTIQSQVLELLKDIIKQSNSALIIISHDFGVVAEMADQILVMYGGKIVESGPTESLLNSPRHRYTKALLACLPTGDMHGKTLHSIEGEPPDMKLKPSLCSFAPRCTNSIPACMIDPCDMKHDNVETGRQYLCHNPVEYGVRTNEY